VGNVYLTNLASGKTAPPLADPGGASVAVATEIQFSPNGTLLAVGDRGIGNVYVWEVATRRLVATLAPLSVAGAFGGPPLPPLYWFAFSPNGATLAVADGIGDVRLWDTATRTWTATIKDGSGVDLVAFSPDGKTLAIGWGSNVVDLWSIAGHKVVATLNGPGGATNAGTVLALAFSPDGRTLATTDSGGQILLWSVAGYE
jgi:WD40 repeat protein